MKIHVSLRVVAIAMAWVLVVTGFGWSASAAPLISTDEVLAGQHTNDQRARVQAFLQRQDVRDQMASLGVSADETAARVATLSDAEVQRVADQLDSMPAGQADVLSLLVFVALVLLITDILGYTNVYPFVK